MPRCTTLTITRRESVPHVAPIKPPLKLAATGSLIKMSRTWTTVLLLANMSGKRGRTMNENLITLKEYAALHNVTESAIRHRIRRGGIKTAVKFGRDWFIDKTESFTDKRIVSGDYVKKDKE